MTIDRIAYHCQHCGHVTYAPPVRVAIICGECRKIDTVTDLARRAWRQAIEARLPMHPADILACIVALGALVWGLS